MSPPTAPPTSPPAGPITTSESLTEEQQLREQASFFVWLVLIFVGISCCLLCMWWYCRASEGKGRLVEVGNVRLSEDDGETGAGGPSDAWSPGTPSPAISSLMTQRLVTGSGSTAITCAPERADATPRSQQLAQQAERFAADWRRLTERSAQRRNGPRAQQRAVMNPEPDTGVATVNGLVSDTI